MLALFPPKRSLRVRQPLSEEIRSLTIQSFSVAGSRSPFPLHAFCMSNLHLCCFVTVLFWGHNYAYMSREVRLPKMWYLQPTKPLLVALNSMSVKLLNKHHLEFLSLKGGCTGLFESTLVKMPHW